MLLFNKVILFGINGWMLGSKINKKIPMQNQCQPLTHVPALGFYLQQTIVLVTRQYPFLFLLIFMTKVTAAT